MHAQESEVDEQGYRLEPMQSSGLRQLALRSHWTSGGTDWNLTPNTLRSNPPHLERHRRDRQPNAQLAPSIRLLAHVPEHFEHFQAAWRIKGSRLLGRSDPIGGGQRQKLGLGWLRQAHVP
jgi:hypothetical protein